MTSIITFAFLHHAAAFMLVAAVTTELVLLRTELTPSTARALLRVDMIYGISAAVVLVVGFLRVFYTEKGAAYYFASGSFLTKMALFAIAGLLSIYPTMRFLRWRRTLAQQQVPVLPAAQQRKLRMVLHIELVLLLGMMLAAVMMARGIGFLG